jgi:hypothetical protein
MRRLAFAAIVWGCGAASAAAAQDVSARDQIALMQAAFAPVSAAGEAYSPIGPVRWTSGEFQLPSHGESDGIDTVRITVGGAVMAPGITALNLSRAGLQPSAYEISLIRSWPAAVRYQGEAFDVDLTPHAGVGAGTLGGSAEAGAVLRLSHKSRDQKAIERLKQLGVGDGASLGQRGRWYLFAAASGRAVGLNMLHSADGWNRGGWTTDATSALVGDAQLGLGWRKGMVQTSLGYIHREVKGQHMIWGQETRADSMVAFSLSIKPHF